MRSSNLLSIAAMCSLLLLGVTNCALGQLSDPIPDVIQPGVSVGIELVALLPDTTADVNDGRNTDTRINFFRQTTDGRRFVNDQRGVIYELDSSGTPTEYLNTRDTFTRDIYTGSLASGLTSFDFHPDFANNGLFYTIHTETPNGSPTPDTIPATFNLSDVSFHQIVTEWTASSPAAGVFAGPRREILRVGSTGSNAIHPLGDASFNPTALVGDADYGMLYVAGGDWAISGLDRFDALQRTDTLAGTMLRIDPTSPSVSGGIAGLGDYTIPADNPFANDGDPGTFGEIYAYGFRNCHRISWDESGNLFGMDIGQNQIEEVNIILPGSNYGWGEREGTFLNGQAVAGGEKSEVFPATSSPLFRDPVAQYDHDEGAAICGGFAYTGTLVPELEGKFVFGDIVNGRLFYTDLAEMLAADDGDNSTVAVVQELQLRVGGNIQTLQQITNTGRVDLRLGRDNDGEIIVLSKGDGSVRRLVTLITGPSEWILLDDFEDLTPNTAIDGTTSANVVWDGGADHLAIVDASDANNQVMQVLGEDGGQRLRGNFRDANNNIASGAVGTVFYRFRTSDAAGPEVDSVTGLTDNESISNFDFKAGLRVTNVNDFQVRDGGGYEQVDGLAGLTWYKLWIVADNTSADGTFKVYLQSDADPNYATQTQVAIASSGDEVFDFRNNGPTAIVNVYFRTGGGPEAGSELLYDDVYLNSAAEDLTDPTASVLLGDVDLNGVVNFADIGPFIAILSGGGSQAEADVDESGTVDFGDIGPFIAILSGS